ncbi:hypothetical protein [Mucilaginibacter sp. PAMB04168]|uniref:hypothetical protein n=1 Tax=Mucilaginibacter sp. PAMB04168 TaxID=3138567 RepID=UPI0031F66DCE
MFTINNIIIGFAAIGMVGVIAITVYLSRQHKKVNHIMKLNKNVAPLLLQQSAHHKFNAIRSKLPHAAEEHHQKIKTNLDTLVTQYRNQTICIKTYNQGLDQLMKQLNAK